MKTEIIKLLTEKSKENTAFYNLLIKLLENENQQIKKVEQKNENESEEEPTEEELQELQNLADELMNDES